MLEGVSVDPGRTMLPVSPQISLRVEGPLSTGTVECCRRARVSEFCFTPLSPEHAFLSILLKGGGFGWRVSPPGWWDFEAEVEWARGALVCR